MDGSRVDAPLPQMVDLVFHQRDKRRDDKADTLHGQRWHLKGYRLPAACRHQSQRIPPRSDALVVFASTLIVIALLFISINNLSLDELQEARLSKIISTIDVLISLTFVPGILVAQGVYTYFWAIM